MASSAMEGSEPGINSDAVSSNMEQSVTLNDFFNTFKYFIPRGEKRALGFRIYLRYIL